jgi:hypothetical protein
MQKLRERKSKQAAEQLLAGAAWSNPWNLVFTNELGGYFTHNGVRKAYKKIVNQLGAPDFRFHDMRHPYVKPTLKNRMLIFYEHRDCPPFLTGSFITLLPALVLIGSIRV